MKSAAITAILVMLYGLFYAPYGINETDGGFLTGLAWQVLQGKTLYADLVYVRPPLPVWLRALELQLLPERWEILGERWIFYVKVGIYSWLAAAVLKPDTDENNWWSGRAWLAATGFVMSAHCYPAAAWHTVDGILFAVAGVWCLSQRNKNWLWPAGWALALAGMCKQSFYPLLMLFPLAVGWGSGLKQPARLFAGLLSSCLLLCAYLVQTGTLAHFISWTSGATDSGQALQHGLLDYGRINLFVALPALALLLPVVAAFRGQARPRIALIFWTLFILMLIWAYVQDIMTSRDFTLPFAQTRLLFDLALLYGVFVFYKKEISREVFIRWALLMAVSWCAALSWGYNLPILFCTPWLWAVAALGKGLWSAANTDGVPRWLPWLSLLALLGVFRLGYSFVYRDGSRQDMTEHLGDVFPSLTGIYSNKETLGQYRELQELATKYGPNIKTLPAFPQANYLTHTPSPLPLDWVVRRESAGAENLLDEALARNKPVLLVDASYKWQSDTSEETAWVRQVLRRANLIENTAWFQVYQIRKK